MDFKSCVVENVTTGPLWSCTAEGRVDTPPTLYRDLALFGCRNGWVYAVRANDGRLAWRFRAAHEERLVGAFGRLESAWPVHGSVLVQNDRAYVVAGRSSFLDGGIAVWCLDPATGKVLNEEVLADEQSPNVDTGRKPETHYGVLADLLLGDGKHVYMRHRRLFGEAGKSKLRWGGRLGATAGMLDASRFNRTYWMLDGKVHGETIGTPEETRVEASGKASEETSGTSVKASVKKPGKRSPPQSTTQKRHGATQKTAQETAQETTQEIILSLIRDEPSITRREIASRIGLSDSGVKYHLTKMRKAGIVRHVGATKSGHWVVEEEP